MGEGMSRSSTPAGMAKLKSPGRAYLASVRERVFDHIDRSTIARPPRPFLGSPPRSTRRRRRRGRSVDRFTDFRRICTTLSPVSIKARR